VGAAVSLRPVTPYGTASDQLTGRRCLVVVFYAVATIVFYLFLLSACAAPSTQERTVRQGSQQVEKVCTEKPSGYSDTFEKQLKVKLPLGTATEPQAEGVLRRYIEQEPKGTPRGEDLSSYLFTFVRCQTTAVLPQRRPNGSSIYSWRDGQHHRAGQTRRLTVYPDWP